MIINSDFKDYYDFVAHQYRDPKTVFERDHIEWGRRNDGTPGELHKVSRELSFGISCGIGRVNAESVDALIIGGKVYQYHHKVDSNFIGETVHSYREPPISDVRKIRPFGVRDFREYKWGEHVAKFNDLCVKYGPIIWFHDRGIDINPCFRYQTNIMKILDPYTMVQDIMACIGSVEPHIPEMNDITKIEAAGFDKKKSFRHRK